LIHKINSPPHKKLKKNIEKKTKKKKHSYKK
jgi:hypothetical protein